MQDIQARDLISRYFRDQARWRQQKRAEITILDTIPENNASGELFEQFADFLAALPEHDLRLVTLTKLTGVDVDNVLSPGPKLSSALADLATYGSGNFDVFLDYLVHVAIDDTVTEHDPGTPIMTGIVLETVH